MIYKRGKIWWYKFLWDGELIRESTKQRNDRVARPDGVCAPCIVGEGIGWDPRQDADARVV